MTYKFNDKSNDKIILIILSIMTIGAILSLFIFDELIISFAAFLVVAFDFYYSRSINRKNKIRIKELSITNNILKFTFFHKRKTELILKEDDYDTYVNEKQLTFINKGNIVLGIANKKDLEEPENWNSLISILT